MFKTEYDGRRVEFKGKHPHSGECGTIIGGDHTLAGPGYVVEMECGERCFLFDPDKEAVLLSTTAKKSKK